MSDDSSTAVAAGLSVRLGRLARPTLPELWTFLAIALPVLAALLATLPTVDLAYQLRAGAGIISGSGIPTADSWTFTARGRPWLDQQWGAQVVLAAAFQVLGWTGLALLRAALVGLASGLVLLAVRRRGPRLAPRSAALMTIGAFVVTAPALALRPQLIGMALFALVLVLLADRRTGRRTVWLIPLVALAWANIHGSFVLAPVLVGLAWLEDAIDGLGRARRLFLVTIATTAATLVTPFGAGAWTYALGLATNPEITAQISEWRPAMITDIPGVLFWGSVAIVAVGAVLLVRRGNRVPWPSLLGLVAFAALGAMAVRGIAWWPGYAAVTVAGLAAAAPRDHEAHASESPRMRKGSVLNAVLAGLVILASVALVPAWRPVDTGLRAPSGLLGQAPSGITAALRLIAEPTDRVWNPQVWGSWLEFAVPVPRYALDSRIEVIPAAVWADAQVVAEAGQGWPDILDRAVATIVVTEGRTSRLGFALGASPVWALAYADRDGAIWIRSSRRLAALPSQAQPGS